MPLELESELKIRLLQEKKTENGKTQDDFLTHFLPIDLFS
jgi:hypothetical protein